MDYIKDYNLFNGYNNGIAKMQSTFSKTIPKKNAGPIPTVYNTNMIHGN